MLTDVFPMQSKAYRTILTHFSQRYPKIPKIEKSFLATTCIAFDLMSINLKGKHLEQEKQCFLCKVRFCCYVDANMAF